jgi:hypothetical protein
MNNAVEAFRESKANTTLSTQDVKQLLSRVEAQLKLPINLDNTHSTNTWRDNYTLQRRLQKRLEFERRLFEFTEHASRLEWQSSIHYRDTLIKFWWRLNEEIAANYERPIDESLCDDSCMTDSVIITISDELRLYGCIRHGTVHACGGRCKSLVKTKQWTAVCIFSGAEVDKYLSTMRDAKYDKDDHTSSFKYAMSLNEFDSLPDYEYRGAVDENAGKSPVLQKIEARSPLALFKHKFSAKQQEEKQSEEYRKTWRFGKVVSEITREAERKLRTIADKVIQDVLFDKETRIIYNSLIIDEAHAIARMRLIAYYSQCKTRSELPNEIQSECIFATPFRCIALLTLVDDDRVRKARFSTLCSRLWAICHRSPYARSITPRTTDNVPNFRGSAQSRHSVRQTTCLYEQFCLGVLYTMRYGVIIKTCDPHLLIQREFRFVPCDPRLNIDLPSEDRIDMFGEAGRQEMIKNSEPVSSTVQFGDSSKQRSARSSIFKQNGTRKVRKARTKRRVTTVGSGSRRIPQLRNASISERDVLPPHLHSSLLVVSGAYEKHDVTRGRNFMRECLNSLSEQELESASRSLRY